MVLLIYIPKPNKKIYIMFDVFQPFKKSRIWEIPNLSPSGDRSTNIKFKIINPERLLVFKALRVGLQIQSLATQMAYFVLSHQYFRNCVLYKPIQSKWSYVIQFVFMTHHDKYCDGKTIAKLSSHIIVICVSIYLSIYLLVVHSMTIVN